jgi:hypothetical protein
MNKNHYLIIYLQSDNLIDELNYLLNSGSLFLRRLIKTNFYGVKILQ